MIQIENLWKSYDGIAVLQGIDLTVYKGETLVILGRSGSGKSVLLRHILGLEHQDRGTIFIEGHDLSYLNEKKRRTLLKEMGMLFQASALFDSLNIEKNTIFYLDQHYPEMNEEEKKNRCNEALRLVGLEKAGYKMPSELSGGMRKRAALARLIAYRPKLLLYDEPTTGLDPITAMQINKLILETQEELGATSIVVTHDLCSAFYVADRIAFNHEGKIVYSATKEEFVKIQDPIIQTFLKNSIPEELRQ